MTHAALPWSAARRAATAASKWSVTNGDAAGLPGGAFQMRLAGQRPAAPNPKAHILQSSHQPAHAPFCLQVESPKVPAAKAKAPARKCRQRLGPCSFPVSAAPLARTCLWPQLGLCCPWLKRPLRSQNWASGALQLCWHGPLRRRLRRGAGQRAAQQEQPSQDQKGGRCEGGN